MPKGTQKPWVVRGKYGPGDWMRQLTRFSEQHKAQEYAAMLKGSGWEQTEVRWDPVPRK